MPYPMKDGRWRAERMINRERRTHVCDTKREALDWEAAQSAEAWGQTTQKQTLTASSWVKSYLAHVEQRFSKKTLYHKKAAFKRLFKGLPTDFDLSALSIETALSRLTSRAATKTGHAANVDRKNLRAAWAWGKKHLEGFPQGANPFAEIEKFPEERKPRYVPPEDDFWKAVQDGCTREEDRNFLRIMLYTSCRLGELCRLTWEDVDLEGSRLRLSTKKRKGGGLEYDWIPLVAPAREILSGMQKGYPLVFPAPEGETYKARQYIMGKICRRAKVKPFGFHAVRHLSACVLARAKVSVPTIQGILRHKNSSTTDIYLKSLGVLLPEIERAWEGREKPNLHIESTHKINVDEKGPIIQ